MPADRVIVIGIALADGLAHAHSRGILHRDIKPANILLTDDGEPMLLDFNLAADDRELSASVGGTLRYMAPEQLAMLNDSSARVDARADVYSLGLVLHELITGRLPFADTDPAGGATAQSMQEVRGKATAIRLASPALASILRKCLQPIPADRYATAADLRQDLLRHRGNQSLQFAREPLSIERIRKWTRRHPRLTSSSSVAAFAGILLLGASIFGYSIWQEREALHARKARATIRQTQMRVQTLANDPSAPAEQFRDARRQVFEALQSYELPAREDWLAGRYVRRLPSQEVESLREEVAVLLNWGAVADTQLAHRESDRAARDALCDEALLLNDRARAAFPSTEPIYPFIAQRVEILDLAGRAADAAALRRELSASSAPGTAGELLRAQLDIQAKRYADAIGTLEKLAAREQPSFSVWFALGMAQLKAYRYDRAADAFLAAIALKPELPRPYLYRGVALLATGRVDAAIEAFDRFISLRPDEPYGYLNRALAQIQLNRFQQALTDLARAEKEGGSLARVHGLRERASRQR